LDPPPSLGYFFADPLTFEEQVAVLAGTPYRSAAQAQDGGRT